MSDPDPSGIVENGRRRSLEGVPDDERLLDTLRWRFDLKGTKEGCRTGGCGACAVLEGRRPYLACLALTHELVDDGPITTVEGLADDTTGRRVQAAFLAEGAVQCGYCTPGFVVTLTGLLNERPQASAAE